MLLEEIVKYCENVNVKGSVSDVYLLLIFCAVHVSNFFKL